jgi:hypothetical protein
MTSLPDRLWFTWWRLLSFFASSYPWVKSTNALSCEEDLDAKQKPMIQYLPQSIFTISAKCPLCGNNIRCKEFLKKPMQQQSESKIISQKKTNSFLIFKQIFYNNLGKMKELLKLFVLINPVYFIFKNSLLKSLKGMTEDREKNMFVITGCPHCNRIIKIVISNYPRNSTVLIIRNFLSHCI